MPTEQQLWAVFECLDEYLGAQEDLGKALKDGLFNIARGKYTLGTALGQQRYPGDMQATSLVHACPSQDRENIYDQFKLHLHNPVQQRRSVTECETHAGSSTHTADDTLHGPDSSSAAADTKNETKQDFHNDPLHWFTALPPQPVRQAQSDFNTALQRAIAAVNAVQRLRQLVADLSLEDDVEASSTSGSADKA